MKSNCIWNKNLTQINIWVVEKKPINKILPSYIRFHLSNSYLTKSSAPICGYMDRRPLPLIKTMAGRSNPVAHLHLTQNSFPPNASHSLRLITSPMRRVCIAFGSWPFKPQLKCNYQQHVVIVFVFSNFCHLGCNRFRALLVDIFNSFKCPRLWRSYSESAKGNWLAFPFVDFCVCCGFASHCGSTNAAGRPQRTL